MLVVEWVGRYLLLGIILGLGLTEGAALAAGAEHTVAPSVEEFQGYRLGIGDKVRIEVYGEGDLTLESEIGALGSISYPFLGELKVDGVTVQQLKEKVAKGLKGPYLVDPVVTVKVVEYRKFFINGHVANPGAYQYQPGLTVRKAVSLAGGFGERASKDKIFVIPGDQPNAEPRKVELDEKLAPGDVLTVERSFF